MPTGRKQPTLLVAGRPARALTDAIALRPASQLLQVDPSSIKGRVTLQLPPGERGVVLGPLNGPLALGVTLIGDHPFALQCSVALAARGMGPCSAGGQADFDRLAARVLQALERARQVMVVAGWLETSLLPVERQELARNGRRYTTEAPWGGHLRGLRRPSNLFDLGALVPYQPLLDMEYIVGEGVRRFDYLSNPNFLVNRFFVAVLDPDACAGASFCMQLGPHEANLDLAHGRRIGVNSDASAFQRPGRERELDFAGIHELFHAFQKGLSLQLRAPLPDLWLLEATAEAAARLTTEPRRTDWSPHVAIRDWLVPLNQVGEGQDRISYQTGSLFQFVGMDTRPERPYAYLRDFLRVFMQSAPRLSLWERLDHGFSGAVGVGLVELYMNAIAFWTQQSDYQRLVADSTFTDSLVGRQLQLGFRSPDTIRHGLPVVIERLNAEVFTTSSVFVPVADDVKLVRVALSGDLNGFFEHPEGAFVVDGRVYYSGEVARVEPKEHPRLLGGVRGVTVHFAYVRKSPDRPGQPVPRKTTAITLEAATDCPGNNFDPAENAPIPQSPRDRTPRVVVSDCIPRVLLDECGDSRVFNQRCCTIRLGQPDKHEVKWTHHPMGHPFTRFTDQPGVRAPRDWVLGQGRYENTNIFYYIIQGPDSHEEYNAPPGSGGANGRVPCSVPGHLMTQVTAEVVIRAGLRGAGSVVRRLTRDVWWSCCHVGDFVDCGITDLPGFLQCRDDKLLKHAACCGCPRIIQ